ncbi:MAG: hypothetical protein K9K64_11135 [Desulfohalobiaceae bacterium]|nr:hypothetical protein [Desulfohalobiaceae bacterium]
MIRTLVSINPDLASVIAMNYACRLSRIIEMGVQPLYVKEPESELEVPGVGWVQHTWEGSLLSKEQEAVDHLVESERANCRILSRPMVLLGGRDDQILYTLQDGAYDLFVEGCVSCFEKSEFMRRINSRLYRNLPCPVIIARNLVELRKILVVFDDQVGIEKIAPAVSRLFKGTGVGFDLLYCKFSDRGSPVEPIDEAEGMFREADAILQRHGLTPENRIALGGGVDNLVRQIDEYSLIAIGLPNSRTRDEGLLEMLSDVASPILLCRRRPKKPTP